MLVFYSAGTCGERLPGSGAGGDGHSERIRRSVFVSGPSERKDFLAGMRVFFVIFFKFFLVFLVIRCYCYAGNDFDGRFRKDWS